MTTISSTQPFVAVVQSELRRLQWSQRKLARESGVYPSIVNRVVSGGVEPDGKTLTAIARTLSLQFVGGVWRAPNHDAEIERLAARIEQLPPNVRAIIDAVVERPEQVSHLQLALES